MNEGIIVWSCIVIPSAIIGILSGLFIQGKSGVIFAGAIPWLGLLGVLLYHEYCVPYQGGGASMWPIAQLFAGTIMAVVGIGAWSLTRKYQRDS